MHLRCKVCGEIQPVTVADEADEDLRTQGIRRTFRAEHVERCGDGAVTFELKTSTLPPVDTEVWDRYVVQLQVPPDVQLGGDGFFTRPILRDGATHNVRVCEDCWQNIPRYVDFPFGLTSPESEGDVPKQRPAVVETADPDRAPALEHLLKAVCLPCYLAAFARVYPEAGRPDLSDAVVGDGTPIEPQPPVPAETVGRVSLSTPARDLVEQL